MTRKTKAKGTSKSKSKSAGEQDQTKAQSTKAQSAAEAGASAEHSAPSDTKPDYIVGIGASAGGLRALKQLFAHIGTDTDLAFVIVVHLSPEHESHLVELLQPHVAMPVQQVTTTVALEKNCVYVIPPNSNLNTIDTHLRLSELEERRRERAPIDHFFRTLADTHDGGSVGIVLTGTGSDGTLGLRQIKERGGLTVVQDPAEAEYDGMPRSAIAAAPVDLVLPIAEIPAAILRFVRTEPQLDVPSDGEPPPGNTQQFLHGVFGQVRARTGRDFSHYKRSTILRRITRRMQFNHVKEPLAYLELLRKRQEEAHALAEDLLINVTSFFRDAEVYKLLEQSVIPRLFEGRNAGESIRVWSVGCATGEEAYSLAILLLEEASRRNAPVSLQVFATDMHQHSLEKAREGCFPGDIETDVGTERLERFFIQENGGYRVRKEVREHVVFAPHNVLSDPPFSRLDLVSCRNLLIYLNRDLHQQVAELFHYSLKADGFLVLGTSESIDAGELFRTEDKKCCVYRKRDVPGPEPRLPVFPVSRGFALDGVLRNEPAREPRAYKTLHQRIVEQHGRPSLLVSPDDNVLHVSADAGRYLVQPEGMLTASLFKLARSELRVELHASLTEARRTRSTVRSRPLLVRFDGDPVPVRFEVRPALDPADEGFAVVLFSEQPPHEDAANDDQEQASSNVNQASSTWFQELQTEKELAEHRLQQLLERHETSQEELKASNEELHSANEELRSTLEELETSKEELQSINEELQTVNQENRHKVEELGQLSSDLQNLLVATDIATLFLDRELRILRFTPKVEKLFNVRMSDRGRPLSNFTSRLGYDTISSDAREVLDSLIPVEREIQDASGCWYLTRVLPYRSSEDRIAGVVITFVDVTRQKQAEEEVRHAKKAAERILQTLPVPLLVLSSDLRVHSAYAAFYDQFKVSADVTIGQRVYALGNRQWDLPELRQLLENILPTNSSFDDYQVEHEFEGLGRRVMLLHARRLDDPQLILLGMHDITRRHEAEQAVRASEAKLLPELAAMNRLHELVNRLLLSQNLEEALNEVLVATIQLTEAQMGLIQLWKPEARVLEAVAHSGLAQDFLDRFHHVSTEDDTACSRALRSGQRVVVADIQTDAGYTDYRSVAVAAGFRGVQATPLNSRNGEPLGMLSTHYAEPYYPSERDLRLLDLYARQAAEVIERRRADEALRRSENKLSEENRHKDEYLAMLGHELRNPLGAIRSATELLRHAEIEDPRLRRAFGVLERQSAHISSIINGLLDISRIARGKVHLEKCPLDLRQVLEGALEVRASQMGSRGLELVVDLGDEPLWVSGDEARLTQILDNLLGNAIKFTPAPGAVSVALQSDTSSAVILVRDTGSGIRPVMLKRIFEPFQQETQDVARTAGGLGLGLALAKGLVELHEGSIEAHSAGPGKGSVFELHLPLIPAPTTPPERSDAGSLPPRRVLIIEDNADAADMLRHLLEMQGHSVEVAHNGKTGLECLRRFPADIVLCDLGLPDVSGYDVARTVRADPAMKKTLLVALTGYGQSQDRRRTLHAGFQEHLTKPVDIKLLQRVIERLSIERGDQQ